MDQGVCLSSKAASIAQFWDLQSIHLGKRRTTISKFNEIILNPIPIGEAPASKANASTCFSAALAGLPWKKNKRNEGFDLGVYLCKV